MSASRYSQYKDSGVDWLGTIPKHWEVVRNKNLFAEIDIRNEKDDAELLSVSHLTGVTRRSEKNVNMFLAETLKGYKCCSEGDLVINTMWAWMGALGITAIDGVVSPSYNVYRPRNFTKLHPRYYDYLSRIPNHVRVIEANSTGVWESRLRLYPNTFLSMKTCLPPYNEQITIVDFLDHETIKIDALVKEQEKLLALLKEKRQVVISQAVTKGIDPAVPMKDSSIEWLEQVPEHWEVSSLKRITKLKSGESITSDRIEDQGQYPVFGGNGLRGYAEAYTHEGTFVLIGRQGALCGNINYANGQFWASEHAIVVSPLIPIETLWLGELLRAMNLNQYSISAAQPGLSVDVIRNLWIPFPPIQEQLSIAEYIRIETQKFDSLMVEAENAVELLRERRIALISAAVTGKIKVCGLVAEGVMA